MNGPRGREGPTCCYGSFDCDKNNMGLCIHHQRDALEAFKNYVHKRLDDAGIPAYPEGPHGAAGCRIGDRLDLVLNKDGK